MNDTQISDFRKLLNTIDRRLNELVEASKSLGENSEQILKLIERLTLIRSELISPYYRDRRLTPLERSQI